MGEVVLDVKELSKSFGKKVAVNKVSLAIEKGEIFGLLGPNGAGKTTLTSMMVGLQEQDSGTIAFFPGKKFKSLREKISLVPQENAFYDGFTIENNLRFFGSLYGLSKEALTKKTDFLIQWLELKEFRKKKAEHLSGGYKKLLNIALSLLHEPEIIFLDKPTVGLDPKMRQLFWEKLEQLKAGGKTLILTTHYMDEAQTLCTRVGLMKKGELVMVGKPLELVQKYGGLRIIVLELTTHLNEEHLQKLGEYLQQKNLTSKGKYLFIPLLQAHSIEKISQIIQWITGLGYEITSSIIKEPNLEDVFLNITGEKIGD